MPKKGFCELTTQLEDTRALWLRLSLEGARVPNKGMTSYDIIPSYKSNKTTNKVRT